MGIPTVDRYVATRRAVISAMRRVLWRHGITTVDLTDDQTYAVIQTAAALMRAGDHPFGDWAHWDRMIRLARLTLGYQEPEREKLTEE